jgi:hypothetical protein
MKWRATVIEIVPIFHNVLRPNESLKHRPTRVRSYRTILRWFSSFTRQVGIEHFSLHADDHIKSWEDSSKGVDITAIRAASFIVNHFGIKPQSFKTLSCYNN